MKDGVAGAEASAENARTAHLEILSLRDEAKRAAEAARVSASEAAEIAYAKDLLREKTSHESEAFKIQVAIGGMFAIWIILCFGFGLSLPAAIDEYSPRWWIPMVGRAFILATIGGVIVWLMRLYRSERHNVIAYGQKLAALRTFESFVSVASRDDNAKAAIISHAMGTIFALHDTGYGAMSDAESAMPTEALVRAFSKVTEVAATKAATKVADAATPT